MKEQQKKKAAPVLVVLILIVLVGAAGVVSFLINRYKPEPNTWPGTNILT